MVTAANALPAVLLTNIPLPSNRPSSSFQGYWTSKDTVSFIQLVEFLPGLLGGLGLGEHLDQLLKLCLGLVLHAVVDERLGLFQLEGSVLLGLVGVPRLGTFRRRVAEQVQLLQHTFLLRLEGELQQVPLHLGLQRDLARL